MNESVFCAKALRAWHRSAWIVLLMMPAVLASRASGPATSIAEGLVVGMQDEFERIINDTVDLQIAEVKKVLIDSLDLDDETIKTFMDNPQESIDEYIETTNMYVQRMLAVIPGGGPLNIDAQPWDPANEELAVAQAKEVAKTEQASKKNKDLMTKILPAGGVAAIGGLLIAAAAAGLGRQFATRSLDAVMGLFKYGGKKAKNATVDSKSYQKFGKQMSKVGQVYDQQITAVRKKAGFEQSKAVQEKAKLKKEVETLKGQIKAEVERQGEEYKEHKAEFKGSPALAQLYKEKILGTTKRDKSIQEKFALLKQKEEALANVRAVVRKEKMTKRTIEAARMGKEKAIKPGLLSTLKSKPTAKPAVKLLAPQSSIKGLKSATTMQKIMAPKK